MDLHEQAVRLHHRLVFIHPFENGNGRHARLVADLFLHQHNRSFPRWPIDVAETGESRKKYIHSLKEADDGNYEPLLSFMKLYIQTR